MSLFSLTSLHSHRRVSLYLAVLSIVALPSFSPGSGPLPVYALQTQPALPFESLPDGATVETVLEGMHQPVALAFDPDGRIFYTERDTGNVRLFAGGSLQDSPVLTFKVSSFDEHGLLGITVDPSFGDNHYVYVYYVCGEDEESCPVPENRLVRFTERDGVGSDPVTIFTSSTVGGKHVAGGIHFGPDGMLYVSVGDGLNPANSQDLTVKNGKIHRINPDGSIPDDNPRFAQEDAVPSIYAIGLRNSFDFTFDPLTAGRLFAVENGPNCDDELNRIEAGYNYGWRPDYPCDDSDPDPNFNSLPPLWYLGRGSCCDAPTGVVIYTGEQIPEWKDHFFMSSYNNGALYHFVPDASRTSLVSAALVRDVKATLTVVNGPDGALYYIEMGGRRDGILKRVVGSAHLPTVTPSPTPAPIIPATIPGEGAQTFPETGKAVNGLFLSYWRQNGGLAQEGYPISEPLAETSPLDSKSYAMQYFERAVFEYHPENAGTRYEVLLSQLGTFRYKRKYPDGAPNQEPSSDPDALLFPETGKRLGGKFLAYWRQNGGLAQQGFPLSEEFTEVSDLNGQTYTVQYFERAVFELHPENADSPYEVLLSQLGTFRYKEKYGTEYNISK